MAPSYIVKCGNFAVKIFGFEGGRKKEKGGRKQKIFLRQEVFGAVYALLEQQKERRKQFFMIFLVYLYLFFG